ncbi:MAG: DUF2914 domain-containing protein [bacterium]|nr:DUF2914 domain-containing protein [bacterium]
MSVKIKHLKNWYESHERQVSTLSLLAGFVFDSLTLQRIDALRDNLWLVINLLAVGLSIILLHRQENARREGALGGRHFWLVNILQFGLGNILGGFFVLYFRSGTLAVSWPFLLILLVALVANELFQKRYARLVFQISFFYLALFSFAIFMVPILVHRIGPEVFLLSGVISLVVLWLFIQALKRFTKEKFRGAASLQTLVGAIVTIFLTLNLLYFTNLIPPIPLSLKEAGIYHSLVRSANGDYTLGGEKKGVLEFLHFRNNVHWINGKTLYAYSAVYSPGSLNTTIVHEWQYQDQETKKWVTTTRVPLRLSGGRANGFRTYSAKSSLTPGPWRVNVSTPRGQLIGRINFVVIPTATESPLVTTVKD